MKHQKWTEEKINFLKDNIDNYSNKELSMLFNLNGSYIETLLVRKGIKRKNNKYTKKEIKYIEVYKVDYLDTPCHECISHQIGKDGYPQKKVGGKKTNMSRYIYETYYKTKIPKGLIIRHKCDNPACINPLHLDIGTVQDNHNDMKERGRNYRNKKQ
jgi:hypothetical protein